MQRGKCKFKTGSRQVQQGRRQVPGGFKFNAGAGGVGGVGG